MKPQTYQAIITITTPPGQAKQTEKKIKKFILFRKKPIQITTNPQDTEITWTIKGTLTEIQAVNKRLTLFEQLTKQILNNKAFKKTVGRKHTQEEYQELTRISKELRLRI